MINHIELPDIMPNEIREMFKEFDYKLPFYNYDSSDDKNNSIVEREMFNELVLKISTVTGFSSTYFKDLVKTNKEEFIDNIDLRNMAKENNYKLKFEDFMSNIIEFSNDLLTLEEYDYLYVVPMVDIDNDESFCESFENTSSFVLKIFGVRQETEKEYLERIMPYYNDAKRRLKKAEEHKEKQNNVKNQILEDIKSFYENYEKFASDIDNLINRINNNEIKYDDLDNFGNIGKWVKIKIKTIMAT